MSITRQEANRKILEIVATYIENNPNQRFGQILHNLNINQFKTRDATSYDLRDIYGDESTTILKRIQTQNEILKPKEEPPNNDAEFFLNVFNGMFSSFEDFSQINDFPEFDDLE